jgi:hypothetical protein
MVVRIAGKQIYLWRAVDHESEVLEILVQRRRDRSAAVKLIHKLLRLRAASSTTKIVTFSRDLFDVFLWNDPPGAGTPSRPFRKERDSEFEPAFLQPRIPPAADF